MKLKIYAIVVTLVVAFFGYLWFKGKQELQIEKTNVNTLVEEWGQRDEVQRLERDQYKHLYDSIVDFLKTKKIKPRQTDQVTLITSVNKNDTIKAKPVNPPTVNKTPTTFFTGERVQLFESTANCFKTQIYVDLGNTDSIPKDLIENMSVGLVNTVRYDSTINTYWHCNDTLSILGKKLAWKFWKKRYFSDTYSMCDGSVKTKAITIGKR